VEADLLPIPRDACVGAGDRGTRRAQHDLAHNADEPVGEPAVANG
jgi:hypothetical protein